MACHILCKDLSVLPVFTSAGTAVACRSLALCQRDVNELPTTSDSVHSRYSIGALLERARILIADDHAEFLAIAEQLINSESDLEVVKTFDNGQAIVDEASMFHPDLFVMDISMPGLSGIDAAHQLKAIDQDAKIVFLTVHNDQDYLRAALATGALGYIVKNRLATDLVPGLREALAGHEFVSRTVSLNQDE